MKILIAGGGRVGGSLAEKLVAAGHSVTVVERDRAVCERVFEQIGAVTICGDATDPRLLEGAGIATADIAAALLARDSDNLAFCMLARSRSTARVMVRMLDHAYADAYRQAGVRDLVAEADLVVGKLASAIEFPEVTGTLPLAAGGAILFELPLSERALVTGKTVAQVRADPAFPRELVFIGLVDREGGIELPSGATVLRAGHTAILVARREQLPDALAYLTAEAAAGGEGLAGIVGTLRRIDFLAALSDDELAELSRGIELVRRAPGEVIFRKGDPGETFFLVLSGEVALASETGQAPQTVRAGGFFGEIALLTGQSRTATATASSELELVAIGRDDFSRVVMANPSVALQMSRLLGERLAEAARRPAVKRGLFR